EGDEAAIEGGVPEGGEEEAVVDVEALVVVGAVLPGHDVGGSQEGLVADAGERTAAAPVLEQGRAKEVLAEALNQQALGLGPAWQLRGFGAKAPERRIGQADPEAIDEGEGFIELAQALEEEGLAPGPGKRRRLSLPQFCQDTGVLEGQQPGAARGTPRQPDLALGRGRAELQPSPRGAAPQAKAVVGGGLLQLGADDEARRIFRARHDGYRPITLKPPLPLAVQARALREAGSPVADAHPGLSCSCVARFLHASQ